MPRFWSQILIEAQRLICNSRFRFFIPIILAVSAKLYGGLQIYRMSIRDGVFNTPWMNIWVDQAEPRWLYIFMAWDTSWYVSLAESLSFERTFFPGYPLLIRLFGGLVGNYWLAAFAVSFILGLASLPLIQSVAESYMGRGEALGCVLVTLFFPHIFLFTTVAYSESLFLFSVLAAWHFYLKGRILASTLSATVATLTKTYGILIVLPMMVDLLMKRRWSRAILTLTPAVIATLIVLPYTHKDILGRLILELNTATWAVSRETLGSYWLRDYVLPVLIASRPMSFFHFFHAYALALLAMLGCLAVASARIDWRLGVYSTVMFVTIISFGYTTGLIRYLSFIFPVWLNIKTKNIGVLTVIIVLFYIHCLILWHQFIWAPYPM